MWVWVWGEGLGVFSVDHGSREGCVPAKMAEQRELGQQHPPTPSSDMQEMAEIERRAGGALDSTAGSWTGSEGWSSSPG